MINIFNIVKSRFIKGEDLPSWYEDRLKTCSECPLNSKNIEDNVKSTSRKGWELIAGAHCTDPSCGCTITEKAKIETESCPKSKWIFIKKLKSDKLSIESNTNKADFIFEDSSQQYVIDYKNIPYKFESSVVIVIKDKGLSELQVKPNCGCTTANPKYTIKGIELEIKYDTLRVGNFSKKVTINYKKEGKPNQTVVIVKGTVEKQK